MTDYVYPALLADRLLYPDTEPVFQQGPDDSERLMRSLPIVAEMTMQRFVQGRMPSSTQFHEALAGQPFSSRLYVNEALDRRVYGFKREHDAWLASRKKLHFVVSELYKILKSEIEFSKRKGYPLLSNQSVEEYAKTVLSLLEEKGASAPSGVSGLGLLPAGVGLALQTGGDMANFINSEQDPRALMLMGAEYALSYAFPIVGGIAASFISLTMHPKNKAVAITTSVVSTVASAVTTAVASSVMLGLGILMLMAGISLLIVQSISKWEDYINEIRQQQRSLKVKLQEGIEAARAKAKEIQDDLALQLQKFKLAMGEMVARAEDGEEVVGYFTCDGNGNLLLSYYIEPTDEELAAETSTKNATIAAAMIGGAFLLRKALK